MAETGAPPPAPAGASLQVPGGGRGSAGGAHDEGLTLNACETPPRPAAGAEEGRDSLWRGVMVALCAVAVLVAYGDRSNLSVAIVALSRENGWSPATSGAILGAFFYGYILTQIAGGYLSHRIGGKKVLAGGMALCSVATLLHEAAGAAGVPAFFAVRVVVGLAEGVVFPAIHALLSDWVYAEESNRAVALVTSSAFAGTILASAVCPPLIAARGWPSVFYLFGGLGLVWLPPWLLLAADRPEEHRFISRRELLRIATRRPSSRPASPAARPSRPASPPSAPLPPAGVSPPASPRDESALLPGTPGPPARIPWAALLRRREIWAIIVNNFCNSWGFFIVLSWLPEYFFVTFGTRLADLPFFVVAPYVAQAIMGLAAGFGGDLLLQRGWDALFVRHLFQVVGMVCPAVFALLAAYVAQSAADGAAFITAALGLNALTLAGANVNHLDIAPRHAGVVFGIGNTASQVAGIISVPLTGLILDAGLGWSVVFGICAGLYLAGAAAWLLLAGASVLDLEEELEAQMASSSKPASGPGPPPLRLSDTDLALPPPAGSPAPVGGAGVRLVVSDCLGSAP
eukprot:tig00000553_g2118.t1